MILSLKHALLGFLNYQNMTGYQLKRYFDESVQHFWGASLSQIYPTLNQMREEGLVNVEIVYQDNSPNAKLYHITEKGREELIKWISGPIDVQPLRSAFLVKLYFSSNVEKNIIIDQLKKQLELSKQHMKIADEGIEHIQDEHISTECMKKDAIYWSIAADYCSKLEQFNMKWYEDTIKKLEDADL